jgi:hypothetical protein
VRDVALAWATHGLRVLPLYSIQNGVCACGDGAECRSPGKHPLPKLAPHGTHSATSDASIIATWPETGYNLGFVPTSTFVVIDFDDAEITGALISPEADLQDEIIAVRTRRGLHVYILCEETLAGTIKVAGRRVADVQVERIAVIPPSAHLTGSYHYFGQSVLDALDSDNMPKAEGDAYDYARYLLRLVGYEAEVHPKTIVEPENGLLEPADLPFEAPNTDQFMLLHQLMTGTYPPLANGGRSTTLYMLACEIYRAAARLGVTVLPRDVACTVMKVDTVAYRKFAGRSDQHVRLWELAIRAQRDTASEIGGLWAATAASSSQSDTDDAAPPLRTYEYYETLGFVYRGGRNPVRISNFCPRIIEERVIWHGDESAVRREWVIECRRNLDTRTVTVPSTVFGDARKLTEYVAKELPSGFVIEDKMQGKFKAGMQYYSNYDAPVPIRTVYSVPGWIDGAYLLPELPGAITGSGYDVMRKFESSNDILSAMSRRIVPAERLSLEDAISVIMSSGPARIVMPLLAQVLAAPLCSVGFDECTVVHLHGPTNTLKTTLARSIMGVYGAGPDAAVGITSWSSSTENAIRKYLHLFRDLPVLVDDYKTGGPILPDRVVALVQSYGDRQGRERLRRDSSMRDPEPPRALMISTGEDVWETQRSAASRTLLVPVSEGDLDMHVMAPFRNAARSGAVSSLGVEWLQWLVRRGKPALQQYLKEEIEAKRAGVARHMGDDTPRLTTSVTALFVVTRLFRAFLEETAPMVADTFWSYAGQGWTWVFTAAKDQSQDSLRLAPLEQLLSALREAIATGRVCLQPQRRTTSWIGNQGSRPVGFTDGTNVYLTNHLTLGWYSEECARQRRTVGFSWTQITQAARRQYNSTIRQIKDVVAGSRVWALVIPESAILNEQELVSDQSDVSSLNSD